MSKTKPPRPTKSAKSKKPVAKSAATNKSKRSKPDAAKTPTTSATTDICPRGGDHDWTTDGDERFCAKCQEPTPPNSQSTPLTTSLIATDSENAKPKKLSAINAAAQVLAASDKPLNCQELIAAMTEQKLWTSPGGATPAATLYSAIQREISAKGKDSRFVKAERGKFSIAAAK